MGVVLKAENVSKTYTGRKVINNVSIEVEEGEFLSLIGESGAGKSTLLYILAGIEKPDEGEVYICGNNISKLSDKELAEYRSKIFGFVFQFDNLLPNLTIMENILLPRQLSGTCNDSAKALAKELLDYIGISEIAQKRPSEVSGGEQQRASIARALIINPKIVFLDEPTGSLDSKFSSQIINLLDKINKEKGVTIVQVTHSKKCAQNSTRVIEVVDGALLTKEAYDI